MVFGEFMEGDDEKLVIPFASLEHCRLSPPARKGKELTAGVDFAGGGDENVLAIRQGNEVTKIISWREKDTMSAVGRFITEFKRAGLRSEQIFADVGGLGLPMADALAEAGWGVHRVNFGGRAQDSDSFVNRSAEMWFTISRLIEKCEIRLPDDDVLSSQLTSRRCSANKNGRLNLESKSEMKARGLASPDRADAVVLAVAAQGMHSDMLLEYQPPRLEDVLAIAGGDEGILPGMNVGL